VDQPSGGATADSAQAPRRTAGAGPQSGGAGAQVSALRRSDRSQAPRRERAARAPDPQMESTGLGPWQAERRAPDPQVERQARQWAPSQLGMTAGTGSDIGSSGWTAGIGSPGIRSFGSTSGHHRVI
ncbi:unnamed protein product, partial [Staurois parvus]